MLPTKYYSSFAGGFNFLNQYEEISSTHSVIFNTYGEVGITDRIDPQWFQRFKNVNFHTENRSSVEREMVFEYLNH